LRNDSPEVIFRIMKAIISHRRFRLGALVAVVAGIVTTAFWARQVRHRHDERMTTSCANHSSQLKLLTLTFMAEADRFPHETNARIAFKMMSQTDAQTQSWLSTAGAACPESFRRDKSTGYVFVADGLPTKTAAESSALIFFCPADSHQRSDQHCHAVIGAGERLCLKSNLEMIALLRRELDRAKEGSIPYSTNAVLVMARELEAREKHARK
jgi:hypothetical protein